MRFAKWLSSCSARALLTGLVSVDPYWNNVTCLLHFNGVMTDRSSNNLVFGTGTPTYNTTAGNVKFGYSALQTTSSAVSCASPGTATIFPGDFTIELWMRPVGASGIIIDTRASTSSAHGIAITLVNSTQLQVDGASSGSVIAACGSLTGAYQFISLVSHSGVLTLYINGVLAGTASTPASLTDGALSLSRSGSLFNGYIDEVRITNGVARYTGAFTPPVAPFLNPTTASFLSTVAVTSGTNYVNAAVSYDGITWTPVVAGNSKQYYSSCWNPVFGYVFQIGSNLYQSGDGCAIQLSNMNALNANNTALMSASDIGAVSAVGQSSSGTWYGVTGDGLNWAGNGGGGVDCAVWCHPLNKFIGIYAYGGGGQHRGIYSYDGLGWTITAQQPALNNIIGASIDYSPTLGLAVAVCNTSNGTSGYICTSPDGVTWTQQTIPISGNLQSVVWSPTLNMFCAVGGSGVIITSTDGVNWTVQTSGVTQTVSKVVWNPKLGLLHAIVTNTSGYPVTLTSPDGVHWTTHTATTPFTNNYFTSVATVTGTAQPVTTNMVFSAGGGSICTTANGFCFVNRATGLTGTQVIAAYNPSNKILVAAGVTSLTCSVSTDGGLTWMPIGTPSGLGYRIFGLAWSPTLKLFLIIDYYGDTATSPDGINWTAQLNPASARPSSTPNALMWSTTLSCFVLSTSSNSIITSSDGVTWVTKGTSIYTSVTNLGSITYIASLGKFCVVPGGSNHFGLSTDLISWTWYSVSSMDGNLTGVAWSPTLNLYAATGTSGTFNFVTSPDGSNWTRRTNGSAFNGSCMVWSPTAGVFTTGNYSSTDGINWIANGIGGSSIVLVLN